MVLLLRSGLGDTGVLQGGLCGSGPGVHLLRSASYGVSDHELQGVPQAHSNCDGSGAAKDIHNWRWKGHDPSNPLHRAGDGRPARDPR